MTAKGFRPATSAFFLEVFEACEATLDVHRVLVPQAELLSSLLLVELFRVARSMTANWFLCLFAMQSQRENMNQRMR